MGRLFGTDGARGVANTELTCELAMNIGRAAAMVLVNDEVKHPTLIIGKDSRISSDMLESALVAGLCSVGANVICIGVVPTPAVAYLVRETIASAGIMISASHNSFEFNGIKLFDGNGHKLPDVLEEEIESIVLDQKVEFPQLSAEQIGKVQFDESAVELYINHIKETISNDLSGLKVAFDCSNGSASRTAQKLFSSLGAECHYLSYEPDGININANCGSTHLQNLIKYVKDNKLDAGVAFDGDADRCLAVDEDGNVIDGDFLIAICAKDLKDRGLLKNNAVVGTVMTNMGFNEFCKKEGMTFVATKVGDRYVLEEMLQEGYIIGGEQSGHVIFLEHSTTGDGQLTALQLLSLVARSGKKLSEIANLVTPYPQILINVKVTPEGKLHFYTDLEVKQVIDEATAILGDTGRVLVRMSGTEPLVRVMLEGKDYKQIEILANQIAQVIKDKLS